MTGLGKHRTAIDRSMGFRSCPKSDTGSANPRGFRVRCEPIFAETKWSGVGAPIF
jgi:hypothetical protein